MPLDPKARFDVLYDDDNRCYIDHHFCRELDENGNGCFCTNKTHGFSFEEAKEEVAKWHEQEAAEWRSMTYDQWFCPDCY